jgi:hypothetical protein
MRYGWKDYVQQPEFLASQHYINFSSTVINTGITAEESGKKYAKAGSLVAEDGTVIKITRSGSSGSYTYALSATPAGLLFHTVDVTDGPQPAALMVEGYVLLDRLETTYIKEAIEDVKAALPNIKFM